MNLGSLIRKHRKEQKLTLKTVAERARISEGFLSQVENSVSSPSVDTLVNICAAMGISAGDLLNQANSQEGLIIIRKREWDDVELPKTGFVTRRFFSPENRKVIDSALLFVAPKKSIPVRKDVQNGQEILCVLRGALELVTGERTAQLEEGDAVHFWANPSKQYITNPGDELAVSLWIGTL